MYKYTIRKIDGSAFNNGKKELCFKSCRRYELRMGQLSKQTLEKILDAVSRLDELRHIQGISQQRISDFLGCYISVEKADGRRREIKSLPWYASWALIKFI